MTKHPESAMAALRDRPDSEVALIREAALIIRDWEHNGHWSAIPEAAAILDLYRKKKL